MKKVYSAIKIFELPIGITCSLFLLIYILEELSYDRYHSNADNIYRIRDQRAGQCVYPVDYAGGLSLPSCDNYPETVNAVRFAETVPRRSRGGG